MSPAGALMMANAAGVQITVVDHELTLQAETKPPDNVLEALRKNKAQIIALLAGPRIVREPPFGLGGVPGLYRRTWGSLLCQCPANIDEARWCQAIADAGRFFGQWGELTEQFEWAPGDIFEWPRGDGTLGLIWWLRGCGARGRPGLRPPHSSRLGEACSGNAERVALTTEGHAMTAFALIPLRARSKPARTSDGWSAAAKIAHRQAERRDEARARTWPKFNNDLLVW